MQVCYPRMLQAMPLLPSTAARGRNQGDTASCSDPLLLRHVVLLLDWSNLQGQCETAQRTAAGAARCLQEAAAAADAGRAAQPYS
jgi:hypothetical protein